MAVVLSFFDHSNKLDSEQRKTCQDGFDQAIAAIRKYYPVENIDILLLVTNNYSGGVTSFSGTSISPNIVTVYIDPEVNTLSTDLVNYFPAFIAHEVHHCLRWPYFKKTIGEAIILEGMSMNSEKYLGYPERGLGSKPSKQELIKMSDRAYSDIDKPHDGSWIYYPPEGLKDSWAWIYHLGKHIVDRAFENKNWNAFDQIHLSAEEIFKAAYAE